MDHTQISSDRKSQSIEIWQKYTLTVKEACLYFNIGEKKFRQIIEENPTADFILMNGSKTLIKRSRFEQYLDRRSWI